MKPVIPDYELLQCVGRGAYGEVWLARNTATGALRAAKIVWRNTFEDERPFQREFDGIQKFERISREHPSQLALFHIGRNESGGYFYYVMELADSAASEGSTSSYIAHTLRADLKKGRLPTAKVLEIGLALSEALSHLHSNGLVHRDVKPSNVIFVNGRPKLADIGLVTDASDQCSIVGTEGYLSPEGPGTPQADIFALGKVLYEAATGLDRREFPKLPDHLRSWQDAAQVFELNEITLKACARDSGHRYQTCDEMRADLALLRQGKSVKQKRTQQQRWLICKRAGFVLFGVAVVAVIIAFFFVRPREIVPTQKIWPADLYPDGPPSTNEVANTLCTEGFRIIRSDEYTNYFEAYTDFRRAIELEPRFAQPSVGMLELRLREPVPNVPPFTPDIADRLEMLDPNLAATAVAKSVVSYYNGEYEAAERFAKKATNASSGYELGHTWYGYILTHWGRFAEGRSELEKSVKLAPSKAIVYTCLGQTYYGEQDFTKAIFWYGKSRELEPYNALTYQLISEAQQALGDYIGASTNFEKADLLIGVDAAEAKRRSDEVHRIFAEGGGIPGFWQQQWKRTRKITNSEFYWKAVVQIHLGNTNDALKWLNQSYTSNEREGLESKLGHRILFDEHWNDLHGDPSFKDLLDKIGLSKVMLPQKQ